MPAALSSTPGAYMCARRRPDATALHQVVSENLLTLYAAIEQGFEAPLPEFVKREHAELGFSLHAATVVGAGDPRP
jgi:hypothetical protein